MSAAQAVVQGSVVNIGSPAQMAYDGRAALWGSPRNAAAASPAAPPSIQPPLSVVQQNSPDGALLLTVGAYSVLYSKDAVFQKVGSDRHPLRPSPNPHTQFIRHLLCCGTVVQNDGYGLPLLCQSITACLPSVMRGAAVVTCDPERRSSAELRFHDGRPGCAGHRDGMGGFRDRHHGPEDEVRYGDLPGRRVHAGGQTGGLSSLANAAIGDGSRKGMARVNDQVETASSNPSFQHRRTARLGDTPSSLT